MPFPAVHVCVDAHPDDGSVLTRDQLQVLARLAVRVIRTSELLVHYAVALGGRLQRN